MLLLKPMDLFLDILMDHNPQIDRDSLEDLTNFRDVQPVQSEDITQQLEGSTWAE